jgi:hypothetical protein
MSERPAVHPQVTTPTFRGRLARRMVFILVPLTLLIMAALGWYSAQESQNALREQTADQLRQAENNMKGDINEWLLAKSARLDMITHRKAFTHASHLLLTTFHEDPRFSSAQKEIIQQLSDANRYQTYPLFNDFIILSTEGAILASSRPEWEGLQIQNSPLAKLIHQIGTPAPTKMAL